MVSGVQRLEVNEFGRWPCGMIWHTESGEAHNEKEMRDGINHQLQNMQESS